MYPVPSGYFLKASCSVKLETISMGSLYSTLKSADLSCICNVTFSLIHVLICTGHLENIALLSFADFSQCRHMALYDIKKNVIAINGHH